MQELPYSGCAGDAEQEQDQPKEKRQ